MITEDYVSFEVAKLLKEKGFNWEWSPFFSEQDKDEWVRNNNYNIPNPNYDANIPFDSEILNVIAPHVSLQMAMKWLRELYGLMIVVHPSYPIDGIKYESLIYRLTELKDASVNEYNYDDKEYDNYEQACEAAIKYCLTNLI